MISGIQAIQCNVRKLTDLHWYRLVVRQHLDDKIAEEDERDASFGQPSRDCALDYVKRH